MEAPPAPRRIRLLSPELANQIAAGEVVERPASVVKELLENSLDAGAERIEVDVEQGGVRLIRVRDNGGGIHPEDLALALAPHATSKINSHHDLLGVATLGFRGEALASIASVSRLSISSHTTDGESGWRVEGTGAQAPAPCAHPVGTTVEMRDLFYNTPARRKFLRAERTEFSHLEEVVRRQALGSFEVGFSLRHNGRQVLALRPAAEPLEREHRVAALVGRAFLQDALAIEFEAAGLRLRGWVGAPGYSRSQVDLQYFFLNGRVIRDRLVNHALRLAYADALPEGRFAAYVLYLEMDPTQVDVNVHPTKHEVRFRESRLVHDFLVSALRESLRPDPGAARPGVPAMRPPARPHPDAVREQLSAYQALHAPPPARPRGRRALGVLHGRYLLSEGKQGGLLLVDLVRLRGAELREELGRLWASGAIPSRPLLLPCAVHVGQEKAERAERLAEGLARFGLEFGRAGEAELLVRAVPAPLATVDAARLMPAVLALAGDEEEELLTGAERLIELLAREGAGAATAAQQEELLERALAHPECCALLDETALADLFDRERRD